MNNLLIIVIASLIGGSVFSQSPYMSGCIINSCSGTCQEGDNEIVFLTTGTSSVLVNTANVQVFYGTSASPTTDYSTSLVNVPATTTALNTAAGCAVFQAAVGTTVPSNSMIMITKNTMCIGALDLSGLCSLGTIYIAYSNDPSWTPGGNFGNGVGATRYFKTIIQPTVGGSNTINYSYNLPATMNSDGASATWGSSGGAASGYNDNNCVLTPSVLPVSVIDFSVNQLDSKVKLYAVFEPQEEVIPMEIQRSFDGINYQPIEVFETDFVNTQFEFTDEVFNTPFVYYQLVEKLEAKREIVLREIAIKHAVENWAVFPNPSKGMVTIQMEDDIQKIIVFNCLGSFESNFEFENKNEKSVTFEIQKPGLHFLEVFTSKGKNIFKVVIQ